MPNLPTKSDAWDVGAEYRSDNEVWQFTKEGWVLRREGLVPTPWPEEAEATEPKHIGLPSAASSTIGMPEAQRLTTSPRVPPRQKKAQTDPQPPTGVELAHVEIGDDDITVDD